MTELSFFDANLVVGRPRNQPLFEPVATPEALRDAAVGIGLQGALIWHWAQMEAHPESANVLLEPYRAAWPAAAICWSVLPPLTGEQPRLVERLAENDVGAVRLFPEAHRYVMDAIVWGDLMDVLIRKRIPVLLSLEHGTSWENVYRFMAAFPDLTCVLCDIGTWSMDRYTYPLLATYPNLHLETGMLSLEDGGVEAVVRRFGAQRLVFGSGFPKRYAEAAMLQLQQADISEADKIAIASENLRTLLRGSEQ